MPVDQSRLRTCALFEGITDGDLTVIAEKMETRKVEPGEHLAREGASGYFFFVILDGTCEVSRGGDVVATLGSGDFFGEMAVLETVRRTATVTAVTAMTVAAMFGADFAKLTDDHPELSARIHQVMNERRVTET